MKTLQSATKASALRPAPDSWRRRRYQRGKTTRKPAPEQRKKLTT
jgi:hypothetical protein